MARVSVGDYSRPAGYDVGDLARRKLVDVIRQKSGLWPGDKLVDVASGAGPVSHGLARAFTRVEIHAVEEDAELLEQSAVNARRERVPPDRLTLVRALPDALPFPDEAFLVSTCALGLSRVDDPVSVLEEMHRVTEFGGKCLLVDVDLTKHAGVPEDVRVNVLDAALYEEMKEIGWGKVQTQRLALLKGGGVLRLVTAKRFDVEGDERPDGADEEE